MIRSIIFDFDGIIANSQEVHKKSLQYLAQKIGVDFDEISYQQAIARPLVSSLIPYKTNGKTSFDVEYLKNIYKEYFYSHLEDIKPVEGISEVIAKLSENSFPAAVASSSTSDYIKKVLQRFGFTDYFNDQICGIDMVQAGKPAPDLFLLAAAKLSTSPKNCLVIENAPDGIIAAYKAGMKSLFMSTDTKFSCEAHNSIRISKLSDIFNIIKI